MQRTTYRAILDCPRYLARRHHPRHHHLQVPAQLPFSSLETQIFRMQSRVDPSSVFWNFIFFFHFFFGGGLEFQFLFLDFVTLRQT